jgi:LEA14-like dessication related protein
MRNLNLLGLLLLGVVLQGCGVVEQPSVTPKSARLDTLTADNVQATFVFGVDNPNPIGLDLAHLTYDLSVNDVNVVSSGTADVALHLPALGAGELTLPVTLRYQDVFASAVGAVLGGGPRYDLTLGFGFQTPHGVIEVPVTTSGTF